MNNRRIKPLTQPITASVTLPGSLSYTIRALLLAALTKGTVTIANALKSDDTYALFNSLKILGIAAQETDTNFIVEGYIGDIHHGEYLLDINLSGRSARMLLPFLCVVPGVKTLSCAEPFKKRPMKDLVDALRTLGANITYLESEGSLPVKITSEELLAQKIRIPGNISSQYFTALMLIAPLIGGLTIEVAGEQTSKPFIDATIAILEAFGIPVDNDNYQRYTISSDHLYQNPTTYTVETDATAASYFMGIAAITKSRITIENLPPDTKQGDIAFANLLMKMGCIVVKDRDKNAITVSGPDKLKSITVDMNSVPDVVPTLAVVAAYAEGETKITNVEHLKLKESDRLEVPKEGLNNLGILAETSPDSITIHGGIAHGGVIETYHDHRIAMSFAIAGAKTSDIIIHDASVVSKSFPTFWLTLEELGIESEEVK